MRLNPITNYMRPCHHGLNTTDTNVFPCILFTQQSNILRKSNKPKPTTIVVFTCFNHKTAANTSGHTHNRSSQHALTPIWMPAMLYNWLVFKTQQPTNSKQSNRNVLLSIHLFFSKTGERNLFTDQIVWSTPHIWAYTNATQPSLEPVFSHHNSIISKQTKTKHFNPNHFVSIQTPHELKLVVHLHLQQPSSPSLWHYKILQYMLL